MNRDCFWSELIIREASGIKIERESGSGKERGYTEENMREEEEEETSVSLGA